MAQLRSSIAGQYCKSAKGHYSKFQKVRPTPTSKCHQDKNDIWKQHDKTCNLSEQGKGSSTYRAKALVTLPYIVTPKCNLASGTSMVGDGGCIPQYFGRGDAMPLIPPCCDELCRQSSQCQIQLSVDCHSPCMNGDIWR